VPDALPLTEVQIQIWLAIVLDRFVVQSGTAVQLAPYPAPLPNILVHLPLLEKALFQLLSHLHHTNSALAIQLQLSVSDQFLNIAASCSTDEEIVSKREQNVSRLRLALLRRFAIELNAHISVEQQAGRMILTLSLPIRST
jgi:hypothetical protein